MENPGAPDEKTFHEDATEEEPRDPVPRMLIAPIAIVIVTVLVGLPVLRVLTQNDDSEATRRQAAGDARGQVALLFSSAILEDRSIRGAERYVLSSLRPEVSELVADLRRRDPAELENAVVSTERVVCRAPVPDGECFRSELARPGEQPVTEIVFAITIVDGSARVVSIGDVLTALRR